jgi:DNA-binding GntR family transcriptional regulator
LSAIAVRIRDGSAKEDRTVVRPSAIAASGLEPIQLQSTPELIADRLRAQIVDGSVPAEAQLSEMELARRLQVSRGPIREALQRLIQEGLLRSERNRGVFVVQLGPDDARDIYLARGAVERAAGAIVTKQATTEALDALQQILDQMAEPADWNDLVTHDLAFHQTLVEIAGSPRLSRAFRTLLAETRLCMFRLLPFYVETAEIVSEHQEILDAIRSGNGRQVDRLIRLHMDTSAARLSKAPTDPDAPDA